MCCAKISILLQAIHRFYSLVPVRKLKRMKTIVKIATLITVSLVIVSCTHSTPVVNVERIADYFTKAKDTSQLEKCAQATFAAGCFWHEETLFESIKGVKEVISGYAGGETENPDYEKIETGTTGHAETINIFYDSSLISYPKLLQVYFEGMEDPTQVNGQGPDHGTQYRSIIFYRNDVEKELASRYIKKLNESGNYAKSIAVVVMPYTRFWRAEDYHQDYINTHTDNPYVYGVCIPGIARFQAAQPEMIKEGHNFSSGK